MLVGRFAVIIPVMAIAGSLVAKKFNRPAPARYHPRRAVYRPADRHRAAGWRPDLYSRPGAWPGGGTLLLTLSDAEHPVMSRKQLALLEPTLVRQALLDAVKKLSPMVQWRNPVMFIVWVGSLLTTLLAMPWLAGPDRQRHFTAAVSIWLWFTVLFANFAEAMAEGRSKAQANSLKGVKKPPSPANCARRSMTRGRPRSGG
jgi:hypothetical protein